MAWVLGSIAVVLVVLSLLGRLLLYDGSEGPMDSVSHLLNVDMETSVPTYFSVLLLLFVSALLYTVALGKRQDPFLRHWAGLAVIFLLFSIDEATSIHELAVGPLRRQFGLGGWLYFSWVIPGAAFVLAFVLAYLRFVARLSKPFQTLFVASGAIYVGGALGMELIGGFQVDHYGRDGIAYVLITTIEEALEMAGLVLFIYALLRYLETRKAALSVRFSQNE